MRHSSQEPQFLLKQQTTHSVSYAVESDSHGMYEVRIHKLAHLGEDNVFDLQTSDGTISRYEDAKRLFEQFSCLELYYGQVSKLSQKICPNYYRWKIQPLHSVTEERLNRVYEVEEFMGDSLIEGMATLHNDYIR